MLKFLLVVIIIAIATYALVRAIQRRGVQPPLVGSHRSSRPSGPIGPDDDEEFLRELDRRRLDGDGSDP